MLWLDMYSQDQVLFVMDQFEFVHHKAPQQNPQLAVPDLDLCLVKLSEPNNSCTLNYKSYNSLEAVDATDTESPSTTNT